MIRANWTFMDSHVLREAAIKAIQKHGGVRAAARALKISAPYMGRLADGGARMPNNTIMKKLGVVRTIAVQYSWRQS